MSERCSARSADCGRRHQRAFGSGVRIPSHHGYDGCGHRSAYRFGIVRVVRRLPGEFWEPFWILTAFAFVNFSDALLIVRATYLGLSVTAVIAAYALSNLTYKIASYPVGVLADRIPKQAIIAVGFAVFGASYLALGLVTRSGWVWPIFAFYGIYTALTDGVAKAWISATVPSEVRGRALGLQGGAAGVGAIVAAPGPGWAGTETVGGRSLIAGVIALLLAATVLVLTVRAEWRT